MPIGTMPGGRDYGNGPVTIGNGKDDGLIISSGNDELVIPGDESLVSQGGTTELDIAYDRYQELYKLYTELLKMGKSQDALKVVPEMNKAKAQYDALKAKMGAK